MISNLTKSLVVALVAIAVLIPTEVHAYIGPGAGISAIGSLLAVLAAVLLGIVGFVWYPVKRLLRRKNKVADEESASDLESAETPAAAYDEAQSSESLDKS